MTTLQGIVVGLAVGVCVIVLAVTWRMKGGAE
jgi:hypothetical protein